MNPGAQILVGSLVGAIIGLLIVSFCSIVVFIYRSRRPKE